MDSQFLIYQNQEGDIKIDVRFEDETIWLSQAEMSVLFSKDKRTISEHISNIFKEGELDENSVIRNFRTTAQQQTPMYMKDWISRLDIILQLNGRELLQHAGKISHQMAMEKSAQEYEKYQALQRQIERENSLKELEDDLKQLVN